MTSASQGARGPSRRTVARGAAWSLPTSVVLGSAPAFAASAPPPSFTLTGACKSPGNSCKVFPKGYEFRFTVCNKSALDVYIYSVAYQTVGTNLTLIHATPTLPTRIPAGGCIPLVFRANSSNSANQDFTAEMTLGWGHTPKANGESHVHKDIKVTFVVPGTPPDCACTATPNP